MPALEGAAADDTAVVWDWLPLAVAGTELSETERFLFDTAGFLVVPDALPPAAVKACLQASERIHDDPEVVTSQLRAQQGERPDGEHGPGWRQLGNAYAHDRTFEQLIDHTSVLAKVHGLLGGRFILGGSWCTRVPPGFAGGGLHPDGPYHQSLERSTTPAPPLLALRVGYVLTPLTSANSGELYVVPGSHRSLQTIPRGATVSELPLARPLRLPPGTAVLFHQSLLHCGGANTQDHHRFMFHAVYTPPWMARTDGRASRSANSCVCFFRTALSYDPRPALLASLPTECIAGSCCND
eukprot:COSAG03_NODE_440_length_7908_cov_34.071200_6_plen_297_part_00